GVPLNSLMIHSCHLHRLGAVVVFGLLSGPDSIAHHLAGVLLLSHVVLVALLVHPAPRCKGAAHYDPGENAFLESGHEAPPHINRADREVIMCASPWW